MTASTITARGVDLVRPRDGSMIVTGGCHGVPVGTGGSGLGRSGVGGATDGSVRGVHNGAAAGARLGAPTSASASTGAGALSAAPHWRQVSPSASRRYPHDAHFRMAAHRPHQ